MRNEQERVEDNEEFENSIDKKVELFKLIKDTLIETAVKEFEKQGFKAAEKNAGMYADEVIYGINAEPEKYSIKIAGVTLPSLERNLQLGGKRITSEVKCVIANGRLKINYNTPENTATKNMLVRKELSLSTDLSKSKIKKQLEELFSEAAMFEVNYLQSASLGVESGSQNYYNPNKPTMEIIKNTMTIKEIYTNESEAAAKFASIPEDDKNINKVIEKNTVDLGDDKAMLLDKNKIQELSAKLKEDKSFQKFFKETLNKFECNSLGEVKKNGKEQEFLKELDGYTVAEITTTGGGAGAGAYLTPFAFKKPGSKKPSMQGPFVEYSPEASQMNESKENTNLTKDLKDTSYFKNRNAKKAKVDKDWKIITEKAGDPYNITVKVDPNTHVLGMPFIKPNSPEEVAATMNGDRDKLKRIGVKKINEVIAKVDRKIISESESEKVERLRKKKFNSITENEKLGVNKRYIITEKTTKEYEKERMSKLAGFKLYESIKGAENLSEVLGAEPVVGMPPVADCSAMNPNFLSNLKNDEHQEDIASIEGMNELPVNHDMPDDFEINPVAPINESFVEVQKPGSIFGLMYKFKEQDFLNEGKKYILDMNSMVFVPNPNTK